MHPQPLALWDRSDVRSDMLSQLSRAASLALLLLVAACRDRPPPPTGGPPSSASSAAPAPAPVAAWPELPVTAEGVQALVRERTQRAPRAEPAIGAEALLTSLRRAAEQGELSAGFDAIAARLAGRASAAATRGNASFVLFGTFHDAPAQIAAFRKLTGPLGYGPTDAALEQLHAPGRWRGVEPSDQAGDVGVIEADSGRAALDALIGSQRDHDHTAWKYDYLEEFPALAATLRASGVELHGCDLPSALQARARAAGDAALLDLRELHCALSLEASLRGRARPASVAVLWGASHVAADRAPRFLPANADVVAIHAFGGRPAGDGVEAELADELRIGEALLFPLEGQDRLALILPEGALAARVDRARTQLDSNDAKRLGKLVVTSEGPIELRVAGKPIAAGAHALPPGNHGFVAFRASGPAVAGAIPMPEHGFVELSLEQPKSPTYRLIVHRAR